MLPEILPHYASRVVEPCPGLTSAFNQSVSRLTLYHSMGCIIDFGLYRRADTAWGEKAFALFLSFFLPFSLSSFFFSIFSFPPSSFLSLVRFSTLPLGGILRNRTFIRSFHLAYARVVEDGGR